MSRGSVSLLENVLLLQQTIFLIPLLHIKAVLYNTTDTYIREGKLIQLGSRLDHGQNINSCCCMLGAVSSLGSHTKPTQQVLIFAEVINIAQEVHQRAKIRETRPLFSRDVQ